MVDCFCFSYLVKSARFSLSHLRVIFLVFRFGLGLVGSRGSLLVVSVLTSGLSLVSSVVLLTSHVGSLSRSHVGSHHSGLESGHHGHVAHLELVHHHHEQNHGVNGRGFLGVSN